MKWAVIASVAWTIFIMGASLFVLWYVWENRIGGRANFEQRASQLGTGAGIVAAIGLGVIWGIWLYKHKSRKR